LYFKAFSACFCVFLPVFLFSSDIQPLTAVFAAPFPFPRRGKAGGSAAVFAAIVAGERGGRFYAISAVFLLFLPFFCSLLLLFLLLLLLLLFCCSGLLFWGASALLFPLKNQRTKELRIFSPVNNFFIFPTFLLYFCTQF
jgi:hypothetical protein